MLQAMHGSKPFDHERARTVKARGKAYPPVGQRPIPAGALPLQGDKAGRFFENAKQGGTAKHAFVPAKERRFILFKF